jgi:tetratricopeptide (TPR) repeat protein
VSAVRARGQRVCLTFCRGDRRFGEWLRRELDAWRIDKSLVGRWTPAGAVPATLSPVGCNRAQRGAGGALAGEARIALAHAQFLVVLCSPAAAQDGFIDAQIRAFQAMGRAARVIPVVIAGEPGSPARECLPPALRLSPARPIDLRPHRDGRERGKQKIVAALLGLPLEEIARRAERARERRFCLRLAAAAALLMLAFAVEAGVERTREALRRNDALLEASLARAATLAATAAAAAPRLGLPQGVSAMALRGAESGLDALAAFGRDTARLRLRRLAVQIALSRVYDALGDIDAARARASEAEGKLAQLAGEVPDNTFWRRELARSYAEVGDLLQAQGRPARALASYRESIALTERAAAGEAGRQGNLAARYLRLGDLDVAIGAHDDALAHYHESLAIHERLAAAEPGDLRSLLGILHAHARIADALRAKGELDDALASFGAARALAERLARAGHPEGERALTAAHLGAGDVLALQDEPEAALARYRVGHAIALRRAQAGEAGWAQALRVGHQRIGSVLEAQGDLPGALREYRAALALAARRAHEAGGQAELAMAHGHVGDALRGLGDLAGALAAYREKRAILMRLARADPAAFEHELGTTHARIGFVHEARGDFLAAQTEYRALFAIGRRFAANDPANPRWQRDLAVSHGKLAGVYHRRGKAKDALAELRRGRDIMAALVAAAPQFAPWAADLAGFEAQIAAVEGRAVPRSVAAACKAPCPPDAADRAASSLALSPDLRDRVAARPAGSARLSN